MPVSIPPFANVPAPGDPLTSAWAQDLTQYAVDGPRGVRGRTVATASGFSTSSTAAVDVTVTVGAAPRLTLALDTTRLYRAEFMTAQQHDVINQRIIWELWIAGVLVRSYVTGGIIANVSMTALMSWIFQPTTSTAVEHKVMVRVTGGALTASLASAVNPITFAIEDIGKI